MQLTALPGYSPSVVSRPRDAIAERQRQAGTDIANNVRGEVPPVDRVVEGEVLMANEIDGREFFARRQYQQHAAVQDSSAGAVTAYTTIARYSGVTPSYGMLDLYV